MWAGNRAAVGQWAHQGNGDDDVIVLFRFGGRHAWTCFGIVVAAAVTYDVWGGALYHSHLSEQVGLWVGANGGASIDAPPSLFYVAWDVCII